MFNNKKIFVLGMAKSGYNVAKLLAPNNKILITDGKDQDLNKVEELEKMGVTFIKSDNPIELFDESFDILIKNPGVMPFHEVVKKAQELNIPVLNEMEVAYHFLPKDITIIGITGSNGKTTTTTMIYEIFKMMKLPVVLGGNIGYPLSEVIPIIKQKDILLLEISDHQLINFKDFKTNISVLTNLCETHLDYHGSYEAYKKVKGNIFNHHTNGDLAIINAGNKDSMILTENINSKKKYFNGKDAYLENGTIYIDGQEIIKTSNIKVKGIHNYENVMATLLVVNEFGIDKQIIKDFYGKFNGVEHRIEYVTTIDGISYYNDSKATNPTSTIVALNAFDEPIHLILGGMQRSQNFHELDNSLKNVKCIYAIGEVTDEIDGYAKEMNIKCEKCYKLEDAVLKAKSSAINGDVVLLSPASASWDQYAKFEDRGDEFKKYCVK